MLSSLRALQMGLEAAAFGARGTAAHGGGSRLATDELASELHTVARGADAVTSTLLGVLADGSGSGSGGSSIDGSIDRRISRSTSVVGAAAAAVAAAAAARSSWPRVAAAPRPGVSEAIQQLNDLARCGGVGQGGPCRGLASHCSCARRWTAAAQRRMAAAGG